ncbi:carboxypeptidase-like regulatory domain-containing protein [Aequorivita sp. SDUM287046]|uniref:Carboxypeptidase-like regulatory domain-containing protein n=1 Tax=Aequorivita aurantiaca TaxID=3053356 RepID=A0ABT8DKX5_9FLAO|nr:carboxypeptidase-like regulatory domain-containing protein [Aequorivita aurantiaca]MDN3724555.1 carboxypeptidase-like regulatory domain-containing protein [Aequorivita aurantiaca]
MIKQLLLLLLILISPALFAQDVDRTKVTGKIHVPQGEDAEGISVYNISSQQGTITNPDGTFEIEIAENERVQITALQYQSFTVIVDKGIVERKVMNIFLNPAINQLEEVVVRPYDLSGNINVDVKKIPTYSISKDLGLPYYNLKYGDDLSPDAQTEIAVNAAEEALHGNTLQNGANILAIMGGVAQLLFPEGKKIVIVENQERQSLLSNNIQQRFSKDFIAANFNIPEDKAVDFLFYAQENGLDENLLKPENEMQLMEFLFEKSKEYNNRRK